MTDLTTTTETVTERINRLALADIGETRLETLSLAHALVDDETFRAISDALRVARKATITLPIHRLETMSRGRGWARKGRGNSAEWGERTDTGYCVGPGRWTVGGHDGFARKGENTWTVECVTVGTATWTIAN